MNQRTEVELQNFFIFNTLLSSKEGEELQKILYYYPITDNIDVQIRNVGLVEGIIQFTGTFKPSSDVYSLHTQKSRQLYFQPEKDFWMVITLKLPTSIKNKEDTNQLEYLEDEVQDNVYDAVLHQAYHQYRLFHDTFKRTAEGSDVGTLKTKLEVFYKTYLKSIKLAHADILNVFSGIQYLPLDTITFLKVQCFINLLECNYSDVSHVAFLYNDHLIWSGLEPDDMQIVYQYLVGTLLPANMETELQGGSMPRNATSPFASLHHGRFITGPTNLKNAKTVGKLPKVYLYGGDKPAVYYMVVYRALSASVCLFLNVECEPSLALFRDLDGFINQELTAIVSGISEYCSKQVVTPSNIPENVPRFIYFNQLNRAYKSTVHLDNKQTGNIVCPVAPLKLMADLRRKKPLLGYASECIVKTMNDYWVVANNSNFREFYIVLQQKNASLIDISEEVKKVCDSELKGIFFHSL